MSLKVVAEISYNHFGKTDILLKLIELAKENGATHVKFEKRSSESYKYFISKKMDYELSELQIKQIIDKVKSLQLDWFFSVHDLDSALLIKSFNPKMVKIASREARDINFINKVIDIYGIETEYVVSTGGMTIDNVSDIYNLFESLGLTKKLTIAHCVSKYPHTIEESNINRIKIFTSLFNCNIGYSGHELGYIPSMYAVFMGIKYLERHFSISKNLVVKNRNEHEDEKCTLNPQEFKEMTELIKNILILKEMKVNETPLVEELQRLLLK